MTQKHDLNGQHARLKPLLVSMTETSRLLGIGKTSTWGLAKKQLFETVHINGRTLVVYSSLEDYIASSLMKTTLDLGASQNQGPNAVKKSDPVGGGGGARHIRPDAPEGPSK
jgi:hypothetical protein